MVSNIFSKITVLSALYFGSSLAAVINKRTLPTQQALLNNADGFCLQYYADDGQLYSKSETSNPDLFTLSFSLFETGSSFILTDTTVGKICVGSEGGGTASQFQCSGDPDSVPGLGENFSVGLGNELLYNLSPNFYACGNDDTGENFFVPESTSTDGENSCVATTLTFVDPSACSPQLEQKRVV